ncbi:30S ribosomal protein S16 [Pedobacter sp. SD-b]|uniref:Small ribosomal subunit protein bS16 n=1 Tax=Pedobacter segetis TaxID=2793069 RepID=A0ABS1BGS7_9SPHI|nr:30S ribosomal protein S16 [Pedobacter segetis]MBK0381444.1 30S ribosomal protein S16 [Pedobacter segetis]
MATKIRLQRHGKKGKPFYYIVVADSRSPRDGKFIERLGSYNPNTNPATIELNFDKAVAWVGTGATPTDTTKAILSYKGVLYKNHLNGGVRKGALTEEQANEKFNVWLEGKNKEISAKKEGLVSSKAEVKKSALAAETKKKEAQAAAIAAKNAPVVEEAPAVEEAPVAETTEAETPTEVVEEAPVAEVKEEAEVAAEETPAAEVKEEKTPEA